MSAILTAVVEGGDNQSHHSKKPLILTMGLLYNKGQNDGVTQLFRQSHIKIFHAVLVRHIDVIQM